jgi:hypothetical protein
MAYGDTTLGADHRWPFNGDLLDAIGSLDLTGSGTGFVGSGITRDGSNALRTDGRDDLATATPDATTGASGFNRYAFQGWFRVTQIQGPPVCIYKQGGSTAGFALFMWAGNNVMLQVIDTAASTPILQFFSKIALRANRTYHFFVRYSGSGFSDEIEFYIDGVKQTATLTGSTAPGAASMTAHTGLIAFGENGSASTEVPVGSQAVLVKAPVDGQWAEWWTWEGADAEAITETQINDDLFGAGAIPDVTIASGTQAAMQIALDALASTVRPDVPLAILIEPVTGDGNVTLTADNITFNPRASIHVRYEGTGTLTWVNSNGSNAQRTSGNVTVSNPAQLTIFNLDNPSEVRVYEAGTLNEVAGEETVTTGSFVRTISVASVDIAILSLDFQIKRIEGVSMASNVSINAFQVVDRQYENL